MKQLDRIKYWPPKFIGTVYLMLVVAVGTLIVKFGPGVWMFWLWDDGSWQAVVGIFVGTALGVFAYLTWLVQRNQDQTLQKQNEILESQAKMLDTAQKSAASLQRMQRYDTINSLVVANPYILPMLLEEPPPNEESMTNPCHHLMGFMLTLALDEYKQWRLVLLDYDDWDRSANSLARYIVTLPFASGYWRDINQEPISWYPPPFVKEINRRVNPQNSDLEGLESRASS